ncbi:hypothetical protein [Paenibacillus piri]|uniref:Uncharacterized protein n=1 Tax=Paenibacillus piri TaxID=2547395 RepID=A0A4R5KIK5_9BACL|nr:hypothetical protein [Paenibacillus piri]TDF94100.1 hypothetical protein E1757_24725 [Paenibacillus piri]
MKAHPNHSQPEPSHANKPADRMYPESTKPEDDPMERKDAGAVPAPIRYFAYFLLGSAVLTLLIVIILQFVSS